MKYIALLLIMLSCCAAADTITGISFSELNIEAVTGSQKYPHQGWTAKFDYHIEDASKINPTDYFTIAMPSVYKIKFDNNQNQFHVGLHGKDIFKCYALQQAAYIHEDTVLKCEALGDMSEHKKIDGTISLTLVFSDGGSIFAHEYKNAARFRAGANEVSFDGKLKGKFEADSVQHTDGFYYSGKTSTYNSLELYYLGFNCPSGYALNSSHEIEYDKSHPIDCSKLQVFKSKRFNDWLLPLDYETLEEPIECTGNMVKIVQGELGPGYRVWANVLQSLDAETVTISNTIHFDYTCTDTNAGTTYTTTTKHTPVVVITEGIFTGTASEPPVAPHKIVTKTVCTQCPTSEVSSIPSKHKPSYVTLTKTECTLCSGQASTISTQPSVSTSPQIETECTSKYPSNVDNKSKSPSVTKSTTISSNTQIPILTTFSSTITPTTKSTYNTAVTISSRPTSSSTITSTTESTYNTAATKSSNQASSPSSTEPSTYNTAVTKSSSKAPSPSSTEPSTTRASFASNGPSSIGISSKGSHSSTNSTFTTANNPSTPTVHTSGAETSPSTTYHSNTYRPVSEKKVSTIDARSTSVLPHSENTQNTTTVLTTICEGGCSLQPTTSVNLGSASRPIAITEKSSSATVITTKTTKTSFDSVVPSHAASTHEVPSVQTSVTTSSILRNSTLTLTVQTCKTDCNAAISSSIDMQAHTIISPNSSVPSMLSIKTSGSLVITQPTGPTHAIDSTPRSSSTKITVAPEVSSSITNPGQVGSSNSGATPIPSISTPHHSSPVVDSAGSGCTGTTMLTGINQQHTGNASTISNPTISPTGNSLPKPTNQPQSSHECNSSSPLVISSLEHQASTKTVSESLSSTPQISSSHTTSQTPEHVTVIPGGKTTSPVLPSTAERTVAFSSLRASEVTESLPTPKANIPAASLSSATSINSTHAPIVFHGAAAEHQVGPLSRLVLLVVPYLFL
ncbi:FAGR327Cp [Eremothecium gossypii FDAG1]|nr:FAGR327Cp [Eremothecium gossypii FDAG1]